MANHMPRASEFSGLSRTVLEYSECFTALVAKRKSGALTDADWAPIEALVDVDGWERQGVFAGPKAETFGWPSYRSAIAQYAGATSWEGTLRHITETPGRVILELEERNTMNGATDVSNTVTIYEFNEAGKLRHLDVYVMPLG